MSRQMPKQMAKEIYHDNISYVTTKGIEYRRGTLSRQKTACRDRQWEEYDKSAKTKRFMLRQDFQQVVNIRQDLTRDIILSVSTLIITT